MTESPKTLLNKENNPVLNKVEAPIQSMEDMRGLKYFGIEVSTEDIGFILPHLRRRLGEEKYLQAINTKNQRDGITAEGQSIYHITVIRPPEMQKFETGEPSTKAEDEFKYWRTKFITEFISKRYAHTTFECIFRGLGRLKGINEESDNEAYYMIVQSTDIQQLRQELDTQLHSQTQKYNNEHGTDFDPQLLGDISLHITLGFINGDVHHSGEKNMNTLWEQT